MMRHNVSRMSRCQATKTKFFKKIRSLCAKTDRSLEGSGEEIVDDSCLGHIKVSKLCDGAISSMTPRMSNTFGRKLQSLQS